MMTDSRSSQVTMVQTSFRPSQVVVVELFEVNIGVFSMAPLKLRIFKKKALFGGVALCA